MAKNLVKKPVGNPCLCLCKSTRVRDSFWDLFGRTFSYKRHQIFPIKSHLSNQQIWFAVLPAGAECGSRLLKAPQGPAWSTLW